MGQKHPLTVGIAIASEDLREEIRLPLRRAGTRIVLEQAEPIETLQLKRLKLDVLLIDAVPQDESIDELVRRVRAVSPDTATVALYRSPDPEVMVAAMRAGTDEFVLTPIEQHLTAALERVDAKVARREAGSRTQGKVVGIVSAKGGCGATTVACHLASEFQRATRHEVLLADFDLDSGLVAFLMGAVTQYSIVDALKNAYRLDQSLWKGFAWSDRPRLDIMPAPAAMAQIDPAVLGHVREMFQLVRAMYGWVLADLGRSLNQVSLTLLDDLDEVFLLSTPSITSLYQAKLVVRRLLDLGYPRNQLHLILNRVPRKRDFSLEDVQHSIGIPVYAELADRPELEVAYTAGTLLGPDTDLGRQFTDLAMKITGVRAPEKAKGWAGLFGAKSPAPGYQNS